MTQDQKELMTKNEVMLEDIKLKGIAWDHPRGYEPLRETSRIFSDKNPRVSIEWHIRSLKEFGDMPIEDLIESYDLITIDHPYMGQAHKNRLLLSLESYLPNHFLKDMERQSLGPSYTSYRFGGHLYALPIDAAALVAAHRADLMKDLKLKPPTARNQLFDFYKKVPKEYQVAWALCPTDLWCAFLTLCAQDGGVDFIQEGGVDAQIGATVLDELKAHLEYLHPKSLDWNPIQILDRMGTNDDLVYAPYLFGYTNYSRNNFRNHLITFGNSPTNPKHEISTILGGVGLAVSAKTEFPEWASAYAKYVSSAETQKGVYTINAGQPSNLEAWQDKANNKLCHNFFSNTMTTMQNAYVRPQYPGWNSFQEQGAELLHQALIGDIPSLNAMRDLNEMYKSIVSHGEYV